MIRSRTITPCNPCLKSQISDQAMPLCASFKQFCSNCRICITESDDGFIIDWRGYCNIPHMVYYLQQKFIVKISNPMASQEELDKDEENLVNQIIDYRNGRYQGSADLFTRRPYGKGMFLDQNYLFVLSDWIDGAASGKTFAVYPDHHIFYGNMLNNRTNKLCAYKQPQKYTIYLKHFFNENNVAIIDDYVSQSLLILYINYKEWAKLEDNQKNSQDIFILSQSRRSKLIEVVAHQVYLNDQEKWALIEEYSKQKVETEYKSYSTFISSSFETGRNSHLVSHENISEYELSYEGSSIVCKINKNLNIDEDYTLKLIGIYDEGEEQFETYKKIRSKDRIEEFTKGNAAITYSKRPKECLKYIREFYKKSTIFYNSFVSTASLSQIKLYFMAVSKYVDYFLHNKYAETFLYGKLNDSNKKEAEEETIDAAKLKDIQNDINRIARKKKSPEKHRWVHCESLYEGQDELHSRIKLYKQENLHKLQQPREGPISSEPKKLKAYNKKQHDVMISIGPKARVRNENEFEEPIKKPLKKSVKPLREITSYLESNLNLPPEINQNLDQLTEDYKFIQQEIRKSTHQTPSKSKISNHSTRSRQIPSPKANTTKQSARSKMLGDESNVSTSPIGSKKQKGWR